MKNMDELLKQNLLPDCVPDNNLNASIIKRAKEISTMKHKTLKPGVAAAIVIGVLTLGSVTAYAAFHYLSPSEVADKLTESKPLAAAFESPNAKYINVTQSSAGYKTTLLGIVTGEDLISSITDSMQDQGLSSSMTYAVISIEHEDGTPMPNVSDDAYQTFCVSPLIHGQNWMDVNNGSLGADVQAFTQDGVQYELLECANLEIFANVGVSLGVVDHFGAESKAYIMDSTTGIYQRNTAFDGFNPLFELPLDKAKADDAAANAFIENLKNPKESEQPMDKDDTSAMSTDLDKWAGEMINAENSTTQKWDYVLKNAKPLEDSKQILTPDSDGMINFTKTSGGKGSYNVDYWNFDVGVEAILTTSTSDSSASALTLTRNADNTFTVNEYIPIN